MECGGRFVQRPDALPAAERSAGLDVAQEHGGVVIFTIAFRDPDAQKAVETTSRLIDLFFQAGVESPASRDDTLVYDTLDRPVLPQRPIFPKPTSFVVAGGIAGLILAGGTLIAVSFRRPRVTRQ